MKPPGRSKATRFIGSLERLHCRLSHLSQKNVPDKKKTLEECQRILEKLKTHQTELEESQRRYAELYDFAPIGYVTVDVTGRIQETNFTFAEMTGTERSRLIGKSLLEYVPEDDVKELLNHLRRCRQSDKPVTKELRLVKREGGMVPVQLRCVTVGESQIKDLRIRTAVTDMTEHKHVEEILQAERQLLEAVIEGIEDCVFVKNPDGRYMMMNSPCAQIFGKKPHEVIGKTISDLLPSEEVSGIIESDRRVLVSGQTETIEENFNIAGANRTYLITKSAWRGEEDRAIGLVGILRDITEQKKAEWTLRMDLHLMNKIIEANPSHVFIKDLEGRYVMSNGSAFRLFGFESREIVGKKDSDLMPEADAAKIAEEDRRVLETGATETIEHTITTRGVTRTFMVTKAVARDPEGRLIGLMGIARDFTEKADTIKEIEGKLVEVEEERAEIEEELVETQEVRDDMSALLDRIDMGITLTDEAGQITFLNQEAQRHFKITNKEAQGLHWERLFPCSEEELAQLKLVIDLPEKLRTKTPVQLEFPGGNSSWLEVEIRDKPWSPRRKIFHVCDVTELHALRTLLGEQSHFAGLIGKCEAMKRVFHQLQQLIEVDSTALIEGDTGTGKELVARAIHSSSRRKDGPFIPVNCAGLSETLLESELFGHRKGAFTGALQDRKGVFEAAHGGTIFLDEIGDLSNHAQTRLLRVLQEREIVRVGETTARRIDVRVIAATNKNLDEEIGAGRFRSDLLYRIKVGRIQLPPLRERREDIPLLAGFFLRQIEAANSKKLEGISPNAMRLLMDYDWPGNVRELQNAIEFAAIRSGTSVLEADDLPPEILGDSSGLDEKQRLREALRKANGNRTYAARDLGVSRTTLYRLLTKYGISSSE